MPGKPLILFDMDGTLITLKEKPSPRRVSVDPAPSVSLRQQMKQIASSHGIPLEEMNHTNRMNRIWNISWVYAHNHGFDEDKIKALMRTIDEPFKQSVSDYHDLCMLMPDTLETLEAFQKDGYTLGLVTNASRGAYERWANNPEYSLFSKYFQYSITRDDCGLIKPRPEPILKILDLFGRTDFVFIGDSDFDSQATKEAGGVFVLINTREYSNEVIAEMCPDAVVNSLKEFRIIIEEL